MAVTIRDVAEMAGVSKAAVSYVLNGRETSIKITPETKERIWAAARALNYHPNALARGLVRKRTDTIALVMQYARTFSGWSGFTGEMMRGASEAAYASGYDLMLHTKPREDTDQEFAALTDGRVEGALLLRDVDDPLTCRLIERGFPTVLIFGKTVREGAWWVDCDNVTGGRMATERLLDLGHRWILHLAGPARSCAAWERRLGYMAALRDRGLTPQDADVVEIAFAGDSFERIEALLAGPDRPTAAFAWSDEVAMRLIILARNMGLRVPEDLSVIGFDSTEICNHTDPPLTSVRQPIYEMAFHAFTMLADHLKGRTPVETQLSFTPTLEERGSCAPIAGWSAGTAAVVCPARKDRP